MNLTRAILPRQLNLRVETTLLADVASRRHLAIRGPCACVIASSPDGDGRFLKFPQVTIRSKLRIRFAGLVCLINRVVVVGLWRYRDSSTSSSSICMYVVKMRACSVPYYLSNFYITARVRVPPSPGDHRAENETVSIQCRYVHVCTHTWRDATVSIL